MIYYAVVDTNVLVSALLSKHSDAATVQIIGKLLEGRSFRYIAMRLC